MKNKVKETSLDAFYDHKKSKKLQAQQLKIVSVMQPEKVYTRRELAQLSGIETSTVSARVNSMIDTVIEIVGTKKDTTTGKTVEALQLKVAA
jgi:predicted HTH transcriptional regulator